MHRVEYPARRVKHPPYPPRPTPHLPGFTERFIGSGAPRGAWWGFRGCAGGAQSKDLTLFPPGWPAGRKRARPRTCHHLSRAPPPRRSFDCAPPNTPHFRISRPPPRGAPLSRIHADDRADGARTACPREEAEANDRRKRTHQTVSMLESLEPRGRGRPRSLRAMNSLRSTASFRLSLPAFGQKVPPAHSVFRGRREA